MFRSGVHRLAASVFRVAKLSYAGLTLIPLSFSAATLASALHPNSPSERTRALAFWSWTGFVSLPLSVLLLACTPYVFLVDPVDRELLNKIQQYWAWVSVKPFFDVELDSSSSFPPVDGPKVYVSNHASVMDPYILMSLGLPMRFVARHEVFYIPLVGWVMSLIGHVKLVRGNAQSGKQVLEVCEHNMKRGPRWSVVFFAEGSRHPSNPQSSAQPSRLLGEFRPGAFRLAAEKAHVPVVPITIVNSRELMPPGNELKFLSHTRKIKVHMHRSLTDTNADALMARTRAAVLSGM